MNDQTAHIDDLPELSDKAIARIEDAVFTEIATERAPVQASAARGRVRRRRWLTATGIAAAFVVGVLVTPPILGVVNGGASTSADGIRPATGGAVQQSDASTQESSSVSAPGEVAGDASSAVPGKSDVGGREIIATAQATLEVEDIPSAADEIAKLAEEHGGYVESTDLSRSSTASDEDSAPADSGYGWVTIRVPSADLDAVITALGDSGEVLSSSTTKQDVTSTAIDLRARVDSTRASVQRLTELMAQSGSVSELIEAEVALTDRQAQLESYEQQLAALEDQVAMSSLQVQLTAATSPTTADPAGFGDGLLAGWNGLIVSLNALVIAIGFLLPWLVVAGVVFLVVRLILRARRRAATTKPAED